ncbi:MAG TPA: hypothetical protein VFM18_06860, partial [Methanosarcina sp.]|nr:hypothetical protein [Methanosarcina sp.]
MVYLALYLTSHKPVRKYNETYDLNVEIKLKEDEKYMICMPNYEAMDIIINKNINLGTVIRFIK